MSRSVARLASAAPIARITAGSRPSETFGTDSSGSCTARSLRGVAGEHARAVLAHRRRDDPEAHAEIERAAADAEAEGRLERRKDGDHSDERERLHVQSGRVVENGRRDREE